MTEILNRTLFLQRKQVCLLNTEASLEQLVQSMLPIFLYIRCSEGAMDGFFPFVYEKKKRDEELQPLYVELYPPPPPPSNQEKEEEPRIIIIQL